MVMFSQENRQFQENTRSPPFSYDTKMAAKWLQGVQSINTERTSLTSTTFLSLVILTLTKVNRQMRPEPLCTFGLGAVHRSKQTASNKTH